VILNNRFVFLVRLGEYFFSGDDQWLLTKEKASRENGWFIPEFVDLATENIARTFLQQTVLEGWVAGYRVPDENEHPKSIGIVMAGNIPLVGFHDFLSVFISGHQAVIKPSSKDQVLIRHLVQKLVDWEPGVSELVVFSDMLKGCDAYIATGSNQSSRYFDFYFGKYPHIIRRNRTSVAVLTGDESKEELERLADDVYTYFGLGCRNITKIYVPRDYDFIPLLGAFRKYNYLADHHKYKNNYDYNLALHLLNKKYYMSNDSILLVEEPAIFSPISQLNYEFYSDNDELTEKLPAAQSLQCLAGKSFIPFGQGQNPVINDYADGVDTVRFLLDLGGV